MSCKHTETVYGHWEYNDFYDEYVDDMSEEMMWVEEYQQVTSVDLDLHRYQCTQCDQIFYY